MIRTRFALVFTAAVITACGGNQSALDAAGIQAEQLESLWWAFFYVTLFVYVTVIAVLIAAFLKRKVPQGSLPDKEGDVISERRAGNLVKAAVAVTVITMFVLMITSFRAGRAIDRLANVTPEVAIKVTGHQWWWEIEYQDEQTPGNNVMTANEIHVPVGQPVKLMLQSNDVIHSLWMPNMHGKKDLIPIYPTTFYFQADKPGTYWGQCAEFCGYQHAKMRFQVIAESASDFNAWLNAGRQVPPPPTAEPETRGRQIFTASVCAQCHTIAGTGANGRVGPDLTHVASRPYIAAGSLQNGRDNLAQWVTDPQHFKPGIRMPMNQFSDEDLTALVAYLRSLK